VVAALSVVSDLTSEGTDMTASTETASTATLTDADVVRGVFQAFADAEPAALGDLLHADATWHNVAGQTGQPVLGPPMSEEEARRIVAQGG